MEPVTPPRVRTRSSHQSQAKAFQTPNKTPFGKKLDHSSSVHKPLTLLNSPPSQLTINQLTPPSTVRHSSRKKRDQLLGEAFFPTITNQRSLFPPTPSTIGSGRSKNFCSNNNGTSQHAISPLKSMKSIAIEQQLSPVIAPTRRKLIFESESESEEVLDSNTLLGTPKSKLITDEQINDWNKEKFNSDDDESDMFITRQKIKNPFITSTSSNSFSMESKSVLNRNVPKQTEITLINKKGEKITRKLTLEEQSYKPRNLFDVLNKARKNKIDVYRDDE